MTLDETRHRIAAAAEQAGRDPADITLIAVSKMQPEARVLPVLQAGQRVFGENRVQEAQSRWGALAPRFDGVEIHVIGPLQTNKARAAMQIAHAIHSLDRPKLAETLARLAQERGACPELFVQVNTGREPQKAGVLPEDADRFVTRCRELDLPVAGLMCIPLAEDDPAPHFAALREMAVRNGLAGLSMGMSGDYEAAIAHGATHVRVGSAIFGARD